MNTYFSLLNQPTCFVIDKEKLEIAWREASAKVHPDRFATASPAEKRVAMQWASRINQAYDTLKNSVKRASYLCELAGFSIESEQSVRMDASFLIKQMQWREELDSVRHDKNALLDLQNTIRDEEVALENCLAELLDNKKDYVTAVEKVRQLMFIAKIQHEIQSFIA